MTTDVLQPMTVLRARRLARAELVTPVLSDGVGEWWIHPIATFQATPYQRTVFGAISADGTILACEFNHGTGAKRRYEVATAIVDDHCVPALWVAAGRRPLIAWTHHNGDNLIRFKAGSLSGDLGSLIAAREVQYTIDSASASYTQLHRISSLSDDEQDTFWCFYRRSNTSWYVVPVTVTQATGAITFGTFVPLMQAPSRQCYASTADAYASGNQVIRVAWGYNPAQSVHAVYYLEIDCVTGDITSPVDATVTANIDGTNLPLTDTDITPLLPEMSGGNSRRLFAVRPGPDVPAVAYADWSTSAVDAATYRVTELDASLRAMIPNGGYAQAAYHASLDDTAGFQYTAIVQTPTSAPVGDVQIGQRHDGTSGWKVGISPTKKTRVQVTMSSSSVNHLSATAIPFEWGDTIGLRVKVDVAADTITRWYSLNPLDDVPTWSLFVTSGLATSSTVTATTAPLIVAANNAADATAVAVYVAELLNSAGTEVAGVDWRTEWDEQDATFADTAGRDWSLAGGAAIRPGYRTFDLGTAGQRVGYTAAANYVAGLAFENPSYDGAVVMARQAASVEYVEKLRPNVDDEYEAEVLRSQASSAGRLVRPIVPVNGGPIPALVIDMASYGADSYTEYAGNVRAL